MRHKLTTYKWQVASCKSQVAKIDRVNPLLSLRGALRGDIFASALRILRDHARRLPNFPNPVDVLAIRLRWRWVHM
jgi:hypothetical protein